MLSDILLSMLDTSINSLTIKFTYYDELIIHIQYSNIPGTCIHTLLRNGDPHETNGKQLSKAFEMG
jgi:hypothetical protein